MTVYTNRGYTDKHLLSHSYNIAWVLYISGIYGYKEYIDTMHLMELKDRKGAIRLNTELFIKIGYIA